MMNDELRMTETGSIPWFIRHSSFPFRHSPYRFLRFSSSTANSAARAVSAM
jgi:hypothetical protein